MHHAVHSAGIVAEFAVWVRRAGTLAYRGVCSAIKGLGVPVMAKGVLPAATSSPSTPDHPLSGHR